jgi:hypothetical protein
MYTLMSADSVLLCCLEECMFGLRTVSLFSEFILNSTREQVRYLEAVQNSGCI